MNLTEKFLTYLTVEKQASPHTIRKAGIEVRRWSAFVDPLTATREDAHAYLKAEKERGLKQSSLAVNWSYVRSFYNYLETVGVEVGTARTVKVEDKTQALPKPFTDDEMARIRKAINTRRRMGRRNRAIVDLLRSSGMRAEEMVTCGVGDVDLEAGEVRVFGKGRKERVVPIDEADNPYLRKWIEQDRPTLVKDGVSALFLQRTGKPLNYGGLREVCSSIGSSAGLTGDVTPHRFRHTMATNLHINRLDLRLLQVAMGHANVGTTQVYTKVADAELKAAVREANGRGRCKNQPERPWVSTPQPKRS